MRKFIFFILLHLVTLYSVSAHYHFVMDNVEVSAVEAFSDHCIDDNIPDFECDRAFHEDTYVFCEEVAPTRRPEDYKLSLVEVAPSFATPELSLFSDIPPPVPHHYTRNEISLISYYSFIARLTPF